MDIGCIGNDLDCESGDEAAQREKNKEECVTNMV